MVPAKMDSISTATIREKGIESVVDWFELHQESFYPLGYLYLRDQQQMEELFYRSIVTVHKEVPRYKSNTSFEMWVSSIFIEICRDLSRESDVQASGENQDLFLALGQLADGEKEAILLTYVKGFTHEEAADILRIPTKKMKDLLASGIQSVRKQLDGSTYNGCNEYRKSYLDYLEKSLERPEKIEFEKHIYHCQECQADLASFQDVTFTLMDFSKRLSELPAMTPFMENIKKRLTEKEKHRQLKTKKRIRLGLAFASVFAVAIGIAFITGAFSYAYYGVTEEDEQLRAFLQQNLGERLNLEAESDGVKVKITGVIADDVQTLVFYKIEDTEDDNKYLMNYEDGLYVENENEVLSQENYPRFYTPDLKAEMNKKEKNVFYGKVGLRPLKKDADTVKLKISKIMRMIPNPDETIGFNTWNVEYKTGEWNFEVPVSKQPSIEYELNDETEIEGIPFRFHKLTIAPTATILEYDIFIGQPEKRIDYVEFDDLEVNNKKVKADRFGGGFTSSYQDVNWNSYNTQFDPLYGEKPTEVTVQFKTAYFTVDDNKSIELDVNQKYPQTFEYAGSTISIDKVEVGQPTTVVISDHEIKNRAYEIFHVNIVGENENEPMSIEMETKGMFVDRNGEEYDPDAGHFNYEKIEQPRHFITEQTFKLNGNKIIPKRIEIFGYNITKYLDETVKIRLE